MVTIIPERVEKVWEIWNVRGAILLSFFVQVFLFFFAPFRKRSDSMVVGFSIWSAYLLADWAANFSLGLVVSNNGNDAAKDNLMALWTPFLLLHFGGADTITAFSLEDNQLWLRQIPGLLFKVATSAYVFILTLPQNILWVPTILIFVAGIIKCFERIRALYLANSEISRDRSREIISFNEEAKQEALRKIRAYAAAQRAAMLFRAAGSGVPMPEPEAEFCFTHQPILEELWGFCYKKNFRKLAIKMAAEEVLGVVEILMEFVYEMYYTKASILKNKVACLVRIVGISSIVVALALFTSMVKNASDKFDKIDVAVTSALLYGALSLETISLLRIIFSEWMVASRNESHSNSCMGLLKFCQANVVEPVLSLQRPRWSPCKKMPYTQFQALSTPLLLRRWCGSISGHNLIRLCLGERIIRPKHQDLHFKLVKFLEGASDRIAYYLGAKEILKLSRYKVKSALLLEMWRFIFDELKTTAKSPLGGNSNLEQIICFALNQRADLLNQEGIENLVNATFRSNNEEDHDCAFGRILMLWHVTTNLCYVDEHHASDSADKRRHFIKLLSDYMLYLLLMQPNMMSEVPGSGLGWFRSTYKEALELVERDYQNPRDHEIEKEVCRCLLAGSKSVQMFGTEKSVLFSACRLAEHLKNELQDKKWEVIGIIWVQMLAFAAINCRPINHVQQVSKGGELISLVWLFIVFFNG